MNPDKIKNLLNVLFLIAAAASAVVYFAVEDKTVFLYVGGVAVSIKLLEFVLRFINR